MIPVDRSPPNGRSSSRRPIQLLAYLNATQARVLTGQQLLENVWTGKKKTIYAGLSQSSETYFRYLLRKLDPPAAPLIHTQRGVGYS